MNIDKALAKAFQDCKSNGINSINTCFYPNCSEKSINSHILQKNGIISSIAENSHVMEMQISKFKEEEHFFKRTGINIAFSFPCFCNKHDTELFELIETKEIDFSDYKSCLLFTLRTIYNEKYRKLVNVSMNRCLIENHSDLYDEEVLKISLDQEKMGISDIEKTERLIWDDLNNGTESFVFQTRKISKKEICLSSFYNYETTTEMEEYLKKYGTQKEDVIDVFINLFPYKNDSILMMAYKKKDEVIVKKYVNDFFAVNEKRLERKITNLLMFLCETWIISQSLYKKRIEGNDAFFGEAAEFSYRNMDERRFFDINIFRDNFCSKFKIWRKNFITLKF
ncbi:hypothetical protein [Flavobacterium litorale]|uniref:Uncharacterized protein n=1 Tax=Flavobacterium litorale TaxID=2856519 RepID=A0ABX8V2V3_9FLAO|nr:hypothetical protein [Flavobacterium litorale]QYJ67145.1 hypothetical protein K1I41_06100 [Flavobacterium litorale]